MAAGEAERNADSRESQNHKPGSGVPSLRGREGTLGEAQTNYFLTLDRVGDGEVGALCSTRSAASSLNLPFENAKCVYPVNNLRKNIHLKEDIH